MRGVSSALFDRSLRRPLGTRPPDANRGAGIEGSNDHPESQDYSPSPAQLALWNAVVGSLSNLKEHGMSEHDGHTDVMLFHAAQPEHYIRHYQLRAWQRLVSPFHCTSFSRRMRQLEGMPVGSTAGQELIRRLDEDLAYIEFAGKQLSAQQRYRVRREMLRERMSPWRVRSIFISMSIQSREGYIAARRISVSVYWPFRIAREVLLVFAAWSTASAAWDIATLSCLSCNALGLLYLAVFLTLFGYLAHIAGPERRQAERFLESMKLLEFEHR